MRPTRMQLALLSAALVITACSGESPVEPERSFKPGALTPKMASGALAGRQITVWDQGMSYTLDVDNKKIVLGDGRYLLLDAELTAQVANGFQSILEGDALGAAEDAAVCTIPEMCVDPYGVGDRRQPPEVATWFGSESSPGQSGLGVRLIAPPRGTGNTSDGDLGLLSTGICEDVAGTMLQTTTTYRQTRSTVFTAVMDG